jgi:O-acetyl-ADP-ribose deacetylase (regulator of RNase III)
MVLLMINFLQGNLLDAPAEAIVNTVNTVGVMGKGIALMFKEAFPDNFERYDLACKQKRVQIGHMFATENLSFEGPRWIINFPTKKHWRHPSKLEWIEQGLGDLKAFVQKHSIKSVALPPLGCGNGGLEWQEVKPLIERELAGLDDVQIWVYEPTDKYQNVAKRSGVSKLTPARALVAEMVRRYWVLGIECTYLEVQKLGWFLERTITSLRVEDPLDLRFVADKYGPYSDRLRHLLDGLDGSYLHCNKRLGDAGPSDTIWFDESKRPYLSAYLMQSESSDLNLILEQTTKRIDGFESPLGMELLSTVDWLLTRDSCEPNLGGVRRGLDHWPAGPAAAQRKQKLFDDRLIGLALERLAE